MRNKQVDTLRGILILMVIIFHYFYRITTLYGLENVNFFTLNDWGARGVGGFFIITGFYIIPKQIKNFKIKDFLLKKFIRIYPAYILCLTITFLSICIFGLANRETNVIEYLLNVVLLNGFIGVDYVDGAHWYVTYLILFYVILSIIIKLKISPKIYLPLWIIVKDTFLLISNVTTSILPLYKLIGGDYIEFIIIGIALNYFIMNKDKLNENRDKWLYTSITLLSIIQIFIFEGLTIGIGILIFLLMFILAIKEKLKILEKITPIYFIGTISYVLYLIHQNIGYQMILGLNKTFGDYNILYAILTIIVMVGISYIITKFYEKPIQNKLIKVINDKRKEIKE